MKDLPPQYISYRRSIIYGVLAGFGLALVFFAGFFVRDFVDLPPQIAAAVQSDDTYPLLNEVQALIDQSYLRDQPDYAQRQYGAVRGMLATLNDRYTFFIDPPVAASESQVLAGTYGGIGVQLRRNEAGQFILFPFADNAAARAGIQDGDRLIAINDVRLTMQEQQDAIDQLLRGEVREGNGVEITVVRQSTDRPFTVFIPFEVINVPSIVWRVLAEDARIGYVQVINFTNRTPDELRTAIADLRTQNIAAVILDLRNNAGGLLQESIETADEFLGDGVIAYERTRNGETAYNAQQGGIMTDLPLIVLVNGNTASAAELVAGALADRERAVVIGQRTYGKGTVQQIYQLSDNSALHITSAEWLTPNRRTLDGTGLEPTIPMIPDENGRDVELGEAVRQLQTQLTG